MSKKLLLALKILLAVFFVISAISIVLIFAADEGTAALDSRISFAISWSFFLFGFGAIAVLGIALKDIFTSKEAAINAIKGIILAAIVAGIAYLLASPEIPVMPGGKLADISAGVSRYCGTVLYATYILAAVAIISSIYSNIVNVFK